MTRRPCIVVRCPDCGEQRVAPAQVTVRCCIDDGGWSYRFICPSCDCRADGESFVSALMAAVDSGAGLESWSSPPGVYDRPTGPLFTASAEDELHRRLLEPDWFDEFRRCDGNFNVER